MAKQDQERVPPLPHAADVQATVEAVEKGLKFLKGLAVAIKRVERSASMAVAASSATEGEGEHP